MGTRQLAVAVVTVGVFLGVAGAASAYPITNCGNYNPRYTRVVGSPAGIIDLTTRGVRCRPTH